MHQDQGQDQDQITLLDLLNLWVRHKKLYWIVFVSVMAISMAVIFTAPKQYKYTQAINIAGYADISKGMVSLIDEKTVIAKIKSIYIPTAVNTYNSNNSGKPIYFAKGDIDVSLTGGEKGEKDMSATGIVFLSAQNTLKWQEIYQEIFQSVLAQLELDTKPLYESFKQSMEEYAEVMRQHLNSGARMIKGEHLDQYVMAGNRGTLFTEIQRDLQKTKLASHTLHNTRFDSDFGVYKAKGIAKLSLLVVAAFISAFISFVLIVIVDLLPKARESLAKKYG